MKKTLALILSLAMSFSLLLTGCGDTASTPPADTGTPDTGAAVTDDTVYTFKIDYPNSENSAIYPVLADWAEYLSEQSNGRLVAEIYANGALGSLPDCVNNCIGGVTDGFWSGVTIYPGVFPCTEVLGLPMLGANSQEVVTAAMNAMLEEDFMVKEWENLHVIALHSSTASPILFAAGKDINSAADMKGINLRLSNAYTTTWLTGLGASPVSCGINDGYEYIEKGIISGGLFFFDQIQSSSLYEQIDHLLVADTIYPLTMFCMNNEVYEGLPADLQAIIDESGLWFRDQLPVAYNTQKENMLTKCEDNNVVVTEPDEAFVAEMTAAAQPAWDQWVDTMNGNGYDGQAILDTARGYIAQYNDVYK